MATATHTIDPGDDVFSASHRCSFATFLEFFVDVP
jgi:hypothetical protein